MARFQTCPKCRALLEPGTRECPYCHASQASARAASPEDDARATSSVGIWLIGACAVLYLLMVVLDPARGDGETQAFEPSDAALDVFGVNDPVWVRQCGQWWRIVTANFVHLSVPHLLMNSIAIFFVVSLAGVTLGAHRTMVIYVVSGILAVLASELAGNAGGGASGAICGMIGALAVYGKRRGGFEGRMLTQRMLGWALFILAIGIFWRSLHVDNLAHAAGFVAGGGIGWLASAARARGSRVDFAWQWASHACIVLVVAVGAVYLVPNVLRSRERREVQLFDQSVQDALQYARGQSARVEGALGEGPGDSEELTAAVNRVLRMRENGETSTARFQQALTAAEWARIGWRARVRCSHQIRRFE